ncbi:MAG TPA: hypothetical protein VN444_01975 [Verrucomicrobiae bacterium]|nr:hypothetical protein [Verrucomicrobiae bacterium]
MVLMGQATTGRVPKVIEAEEFILRDDTGKERAAMRVSADDIVRLEFFGNDGKHCAGLVLLADGSPSLKLRDAMRNRAVLGHTELESRRMDSVQQQPVSSVGIIRQGWSRHVDGAVATK